MKNYLIGGLVIIVLALSFGIEPVQRVVNELTNRGTLRGVETCIDYSESQIVSQDAIRASCVETFQKRIYNQDVATGMAGPQFEQEKVRLEGTLQNRTADYVTTWIRISIKIYDADGAKSEDNADTSIWIEPMGESNFSVEFLSVESNQFEGIEGCDLEDEAPKACWSWGIVDVKGLDI